MPALIGMPGRVDVLTTEILPQHQGNAAAARPRQRLLGHPASGRCRPAVLLLRASPSMPRSTRASPEKATGHGRSNLGRAAGSPAAIIFFNFLIVLRSRLFAIFWMSVMPFIRPIRWVGVSADDRQALRRGPQLPVLHRASWSIRSLVAAGTATVAMLLAVIAGWLAARRRPGGAIVDQLITVPLVFPGLVMGVALLETRLAACRSRSTGPCG